MFSLLRIEYILDEYVLFGHVQYQTVHLMNEKCYKVDGMNKGLFLFISEIDLQ